MSNDDKAVTLRAVTEQDEAFLLEVYASTRADELALTQWDEAQREVFLRMQFAAQLSHYRTHYPDGEHLVILLGGNPIGRVYVARLEGEIRILDITILPRDRNVGTGTAILNDLMAEASRVGKPLRIHVESYNRSRRLFERLGFVKSGESGYSDLLEWRP